MGTLEGTQVKDAMIENVITIATNTSINEAARLLRQWKIGGLPVVEDGKLSALITVTDVLEAFSEKRSGQRRSDPRLNLKDLLDSVISFLLK
jgi:acetoin utilization protein AcuB